MSSKNETIDKVIRLHNYCVQEYDEFLTAMEKNNSMVFTDDQWPSELKEQLLDQGRPVYSLNMELPLVLQLLGMQRSAPRSWKVVPFDDVADDDVAKVLSKLLLHIANDNDLDYIDEDVFTAGVVGRVGWYYVDMDYGEDVRGRIRVCAEAPETIFVDPDARSVDQTDWRYVMRSVWMSWDEIKAHPIWGDKLPDAVPKSAFMQRAWELIKARLPGALRNAAQDHLVDVHNNLYRVIEYWERKYRKVVTLIDPMTGDRRILTQGDGARELINRGWDAVAMGSRAFIDKTTVIPYADAIVHEQTYNRRYYPFVGFWPLKLAGLPLLDCISYVEPLHGAQEEKNRNRSVLSDTLQRTVNGALLLPPGEAETAVEIRERGSEPGAVIVKRTDRPIERLDQPFPMGTQHLHNVNDVDLQRISGQPLAQRGESESSEESGALFRAKVQQGSVTLQPIFSAFGRARRILARVLIEFIQSEYDTRRVFRIIGEDQNELVEINDQTQMVSPMGELINRVLNDVTIGRYDVVLEEEPFHRTQREEEFRILAEIIKVMPPDLMRIVIPDIFENSSLANRKEIANRLRVMVQPAPLQGGVPALPNPQGAIPGMAGGAGLS